MKVTLEALLAGGQVLPTSAEIETFADLGKLGRKLQDNVRGVKKLLPDMASAKVEKLRFAKE